MGFFIAKILLFLFLIGATYFVYALLSEKRESNDNDDLDF